MATRRNFGDRVGALADILLRSHLQSNQAEKNNQMELDRQTQMANLQANNSVLEALKSNPSLADRIRSSNPNARVGGFNVGVFVPSPEEDVQDTGKGIGDISELGKLPTELDMDARLHAMPGYPAHSDTEDRLPIEQLMKQVAARRAAIISGMPKTQVSGVTPNPDGTTTPNTQFVNPFDAANNGPIQTGPSPTQAGVNAGVTKRNELTTPGLTQAEIDSHNQLTTGTMGVDATAAGKKAGAEAGAKQPYELEQIRAKAKADLDKEANISAWRANNIPTQQTQTMMEGATMMVPQIKKVRQEADALNMVGMFGPIMARVRQAMEKVGTSDDPDRLIQIIGQDKELQKDRLVGKFATDLAFLVSGSARVHGGARGGGSPAMISYMKSTLSDIGDMEMFNGRMDSVDELMRKYAAGPFEGKKLTAPSGVDLAPGVTPTDPQNQLYQQFVDYMNKARKP